MTKDDIKNNIVDRLAKILNVVLFTKSVDNAVINRLYDDIMIDLEQILRAEEKHRIIDDIYTLTNQMIHDLERRNRRKVPGQLITPHRDFFISPIYLNEGKEVEKRRFSIETHKNYYKGYLLADNGDVKEVYYLGIGSIYNMNIEIKLPNMVRFYPFYNRGSGSFFYGLTENNEICDIPYSFESVRLLMKLGRMKK